MINVCPLCGRDKPLTFHHLIPRKIHRRTYYRKNYTRAELNKGIDICRPCHSAIHKFYDEMHLAKELNTLELLLADPALKKHFEWMSRQR